MQNIEFDNNAIFSLSPDYLLYKGKDGESDFFIFNTLNGKVFRLNSTSYTMMETFDGKRRFSDVISIIQKRYAVSPDQLSSDLSSLLGEWLDKKILYKKDSLV